MFRYAKWALLFFSLVSCGSQDNFITEEQTGSHISSIQTQGSSKENCRKIEWKVKLHFVDDDIGRDDIEDYRESDDFILCNDPTGSNLEVIQYDQKHGNEMRGDIYFYVQYIENGDIYIWGSLLMFEGWSPDTDDMDGESRFGKLIKKGRKSKKITTTVESNEFNDHSRIDCTVRLKIKKL